MISQKRKALLHSLPVMRALSVLSDMLYPPKCALCRVPVDAAHTFCGECFVRLHFIAAPQCECCGLPFSHASEVALRCGDCLTKAPPYALARAALVYDEVSRPLVTRLKYGDQLHLAPLLARLMGQAGAAVLKEADWLIPVPLHWRRRVRRRYNQSLVLATHLGQQYDVPVLADGLQRIRATVPQVGLSRSQRQRNVASAFQMKEQSRPIIAGKTLVLIDDVMTSGATLHACTKALSAAGAAEIRILTLARRVSLH